MFNLKVYLIYKLIFWALLFIPAYLTVKQIQVIHYGQKLQQEGQIVMGKVIAVATRTVADDDGVTNYYQPVVQYNIDKISFERKLQETVVSYQKDEMIELLYMKESPDLVIHNNYKVLFSDAIAFITVIGLFTVTIGGFVYFILRKANHFIHSYFVL